MSDGRTVPRPEYPRPDLDRSHRWTTLNGDWDFHAGPLRTRPGGGWLLDDPADWDATIVVPFAWETPASGITQHWLDEGWYRRVITVPDSWAGEHAVLHVGAAHHEATVWVDGDRVAVHRGGQLPFEVDLTDTAGLGAGGSATVVIGVRSPLDRRQIAHGKQRSLPPDVYDSCSFTPTSGIWQSVWLEARPATFLRALTIRAGADLKSFTVDVEVAGPDTAGCVVGVTVDGCGPETTTRPVDGVAHVEVAVPAARLWTPEDPHRYPVAVRVDSIDGRDDVRSAAGLRTVTTAGDHLLLNGQRIWLRGVLDQGYWPGTGLTPPSDEAMIADLSAARDCGFTLVRKHMKLEDPRWLWHADALGMLVWVEPASTGVFTDPARESFEEQIPVMVARDGNHPSIVIWGLYNEEWGLDWSVEDDPRAAAAVSAAYRLTKSLDPTRPVVDNSGWSHVDTDLLDWHVYAPDQAGWAADLADLADGGRHGFLVPLDPQAPTRKYLMADHTAGAGRPNLNGEYGVGATSVQRAWAMRWQTQELRRHDRFSGAVYTELYDVEHEQAGILTFAREPKDTANQLPADTHAATVLVVDLVPEAPGRDLTTGPDGTVTCTVHLSHHGPTHLSGTLSAGWGPTAGPPPTDAPRPLATVTITPFQLTAGTAVHDRLPAHADSARLHLTWVAVGGQSAHTVIDVVRGRPGTRADPAATVTARRRPPSAPGRPVSATPAASRPARPA